MFDTDAVPAAQFHIYLVHGGFVYIPMVEQALAIKVQHPEQHRPITHREAARFQSFPDTFTFQGSKIEIARQIGNAVPPRLAAAVAQSVEQILTLKTR